MEYYRERLRHVVRPEDPSDRDPSDSVMLEDYEALFLTNALTSYAAYEADTQLEEDLCLAYAEYIDMVIRDEGENQVYLYAHTEEARGLLYTVFAGLEGADIGRSLRESWTETFGDKP